MTQASSQGQQARLIPREVLFGNPERAQARLSPDGGRLSFLAPVEGVLNVWVGPVDGDLERDFTPVTDDRSRGIRAYFWTEDNEHLVYLQDRDGDENWRLYAVDPGSNEPGEARDLTPFEGVQAQVIGRSRRRPGEILVGLNDRDERLHDAHRLTVATGGLELAAENPGDISGWEADEDLRVRAAVRTRPDGGSDLLYREAEADGWRELLRWDREDSLNSGPLGFTGDGSRMYLLDSREANASRLVVLDPQSGETDTIAEDPQYDVGGVELNPESREVEAVAFVRARTEWVVLGDAVREDFKALRSLHPGDLAVVSRDHADRRWLVAFDADDGPAAYFYYDREAKGGAHLFDSRSDLAGYTLASMEPVSFAARDGLEIHGYLTLPPGAAASELPVVLNVHGGPWARDMWGYNPEAQWLANRGYACLQVNFRGSTGYGKQFVNAGDREWGADMHDDLVDAVRWVVSEGIADPERVAIFGGSYGGYAALAGAAFTPEVFRCAVDIVGPSNLITLIQSIPPYWSTLRSTFTERVGDPDNEPEFLESRSPLFYVDDIGIPILIAQGANDPRVKQQESEQIVAALREKGLDHEYLLFEDEGHGFARPENRLRFYAAAEEFLARHLGGHVHDGG
ncbi:S9 family peptidase [Rubrobacter aplysinae]|uniref:S9 family peptidase n=1 Tax=Rubrobacter aplysinae TaxID=909625 RepID=UPI0019110981|nr:S9 family peptidase [Rubrobacter aplysinae]